MKKKKIGIDSLILSRVPDSRVEIVSSNFELAAKSEYEALLWKFATADYYSQCASKVLSLGRYECHWMKSDRNVGIVALFVRNTLSAKERKEIDQFLSKLTVEF